MGSQESDTAEQLSTTTMKSKRYFGNSLVIQWLDFMLPLQSAQVQSLVGELRVHKPHGVAKKKKKKIKRYFVNAQLRDRKCIIFHTGKV